DRHAKGTTPTAACQLPACRSLLPVRRQHLPLVDSGRPAGLHLHLQPERRGPEGGEADLDPAVLRNGIRGLDRLPLAAILAEHAPGGREAALAPAGVVEPVDADAVNRQRRLPGVLDPLLAALVRPPVPEGGGLLAGALRLDP